MPASLDEVIGLLDLEPLEVGLYRGSQPEGSTLPRVFGGQVAAQALMAAQLTVPEERHVHSLHLYFILGGDPSIPIVYDVENVRDGRSFTTRRVAARQHGEIIFYMTASFQVVEDGWEHQDAMPDVPSPDEATPLSRSSSCAGRRRPSTGSRSGRPSTCATSVTIVRRTTRSASSSRWCSDSGSVPTAHCRTPGRSTTRHSPTSAT